MEKSWRFRSRREKEQTMMNSSLSMMLLIGFGCAAVGMVLMRLGRPGGDD